MLETRVEKIKKEEKKTEVKVASRTVEAMEMDIRKFEVANKKKNKKGKEELRQW